MSKVATKKHWRNTDIYEDSAGGVRVDKDKGIIYNVLVVGKKKRNKRYYTDEAREDAVRRGIYKGLAVYVGPHNRSRHDKKNPDMHAGDLQDPRNTDDGIRADILYNRATRGGAILLEAAERFPDKFGLSHHADVAGWETDDGERIVTRILEASLVDMVKDPATTDGVFEEAEVPTPPLKTLDQLVADFEASIGAAGLPEKRKSVVAKHMATLKAALKGEGEEAEESVDIAKLIEDSVAKAVKAALPAPAAAAVAPVIPVPAAAPAKRAPKSTARQEVTESVETPAPVVLPKSRKDILEAYGAGEE